MSRNRSERLNLSIDTDPQQQETASLQSAVARSSSRALAPNLMELERFLLSAKSATYAAQGDAASVTPLLADSKQLEYREGPLLYRDIYVGMFRFVGHELVYRSLNAVWSMSYAGGLAANTSQELARPVYAHLRESLLGAPASLPLRGPAVFEDGSMKYTCSTNGSIDWFHGVESIFHEGHLVYELRFAGGSLE